mmetsp:Transcript_34321/g.80297  ORF Transcript_34321/g.80297 Transcript_34321/m.80297 type:complete len:624 (-) Transcript_34321:104-1975(-)
MSNHAQAKGSRPSSGGRLRAFAKTKLCKFHLIGACTRGSDCKFAHSKNELLPQPDLTCTKLCKAILETGECTDPECSFAHRIEELRPTSAFFRTKMCQFHLLGHCRLGSQCNFAHSPEELREHLGAAADLDELMEAELAALTPQQQLSFSMQGGAVPQWQGSPIQSQVSGPQSLSGEVPNLGAEASFPSTPAQKPKTSRRSQASTKKGRPKGSSEGSARGYSSATSSTASSEHHSGFRGPCPGVNLQGHWPDRRFDQCSSSSSSRDPVLGGANTIDGYRGEANMPNLPANGPSDGKAATNNVGFGSPIGFRQQSRQMYSNAPVVDQGERSLESVVGAAVASVVAADRGLAPRLEAQLTNLKGLLDVGRLDPASYAAGLETALSLGAASAAHIAQAVSSPPMRPVNDPAIADQGCGDVFDDTLVFQSYPGPTSSNMMRVQEKQPLRLVRSAEGRLDLMGGCRDDADGFDSEQPSAGPARLRTNRASAISWEDHQQRPQGPGTEQYRGSFLGAGAPNMMSGYAEADDCRSAMSAAATPPGKSKGKKIRPTPQAGGGAWGAAPCGQGIRGDNMLQASHRMQQAAGTGQHDGMWNTGNALPQQAAAMRTVRTADAALCTLAETVFEE